MLNRWEKIENNKIKLEIEIAAPEVETALARAYRKVVKKVALPGFRRGKVPRRILESRYGPEILHEDALEILVPPAYEQALEETGMEPIDRPEFELQQIEEGKPLLFSAIVEVLPEVELGEYKGIEVEQEEVAVTGEQIDNYLQSLREQHSRLIPKEEGTINSGDLTVIDFQGFLDGEPFEGGEAENYSLEIGSQTFVPGFEEQLIGAAPDEEKEIKVKFPDDYRKEELAGKEVLFKVKVRQVKEKQLPDLNDDLVKEISDFETLEEFKADARERMEKNARDQAKVKLEEDLVGKASDNAKVEVPQLLVERQIDRMIADMEQYLRYQGLDLEKFAEMSGKSVEEMRKDKEEEAEKRTKANLVLDAIVKKEGITVEESEIDEKLAGIASTYNDDPERVKDVFTRQGRIELIREEIRIRKAVDLLVSEARVKNVKKTG